jgi:RHS repeat-associated protein
MRLSIRRIAPSSPVAPKCWATTYQTNNSNQINYTTLNGVNTYFQYDADGDLIGDGTHTYQWDTRWRLASVDGVVGQTSGQLACPSPMTWTACNIYDTKGRRVQEVTQTSTANDVYGVDDALLWRNTGGDVNTRAFVPFNGRILAEYYGGSTPGTLFDHPDNVGTVMASTSYNGTSCQDSLYYPYGEFWTGAGNCGMHQTFASLPDYDAETDQYNTANRHYSPMGRWMSPDPGNAGADPGDPQTWNMYAYVRNNPTTFTDPTGLVGCYNGCNQPASGVTGAASGSPYGESFNSFGTIMGNDIFDALRGDPGNIPFIRPAWKYELWIFERSLGGN